MLFSSTKYIYLFLLAAALLNIYWGLFTYFRSRKSHTSLLFAISCFFLAFWCLGIGLLSSPLPGQIRALGLRVAFLGGLPIPLLLLLFSREFPNRKVAFSLPVMILLFVPSVILLLALPGDSLLATAVIGDGIKLILGPLSVLYSLHYVVYFLLAAAFMFGSYRQASGREKNRYYYFISGILLTCLIGGTFNLVLVHFFHNSRLVYLGPLATIIFVLMTAYAILRFRLMDISLVFKKTTAYSLLTILITFVYLAVILAFELLFRSVYSGNFSYWSTLPIAFIIAVTFSPLRERLQNIIDRMFFRRTVFYQGAIKEMARMIASVTNLNALFRLIDQTLIKIMCLKTASVLILEEQKGHYAVEKTNGLPESVKGIIFKLDDPLIVYIKTVKREVLLDDINNLLEDPAIKAEEKTLLQAVARRMEELRAAIAVRLLLKGN